MDGGFWTPLGIGVMIFLIYAGDGLNDYLRNKNKSK